MVAVDDSVIQFHGSRTVKRYILTLLNIVSAIYGDPTLGADLKFVILRLIFFEGRTSFNPIDENNSKQSLENVNRYVKLQNALDSSILGSDLDFEKYTSSSRKLEFSISLLK